MKIDTLHIQGCDPDFLYKHRIILRNNNIECLEHTNLEEEIKILEIFPYANGSLCAIAIYLHRQNRYHSWMKYMSPLVHRENEIAIFPHSGNAIVVFRVYKSYYENTWIYELANRYSHE